MARRLAAYVRLVRRSPLVRAVRDRGFRERCWASVTFAAIALASLSGVDLIITGGADWGPATAAAAPSAPLPSPRGIEIKGRYASGGAVSFVSQDLSSAPLRLPHEDYSVATEELLGGPAAPEIAWDQFDSDFVTLMNAIAPMPEPQP